MKVKLLILIVLILVSVLITYGFIGEIEKESRKIDYCKDNGWDGLSGSRIGETGFKCYREVPSSTGLGTEVERSGTIK